MTPLVTVMMWVLSHTWTASAISSSVASGGGAPSSFDVTTGGAVGGATSVLVLGLLLDVLAAAKCALSTQVCTHWGVGWEGMRLWTIPTAVNWLAFMPLSPWQLPLQLPQHRLWLHCSCL